MSTYAETYERAAKEQKNAERRPRLAAARKAFLETGKTSMSIRNRVVLPRDDLDEKLLAAIKAYTS